jgi:hypothetical protein
VITIKSNLKDVSAFLRQLPQKQIAFATSLAINKTAKIAKADLQAEISRVFHSPTRWAVNSLYIKPSNKRNLTARIWVKDDAFKGTPASKYLAAEIFGGPRKHKKFEKALIARGLMPSNMYAVPGKMCPLDGNGNIPGPFIVQLLAYFQAFGEQGYKANMTKKGITRINKQHGRAYFVGRPGDGLPLGIWARYSFAHGSAIKPIIIFVRRPNYSKRFKFFDVIDRSVSKNFNEAFGEAFKEAMGSMR